MAVKLCVFMNKNNECDVREEKPYACPFVDIYLENLSPPPPESLCEDYESGDIFVEVPEDIYMSY